MDVGNLEHKCAAWRRLTPRDDQLGFEACLVARDMCEVGLRGRDGALTRRLRRMLAEADSEVHRLFCDAELTDGQLAELRDVMEDYRCVYYGPLRHHFAPSPQQDRWWLWLDGIASDGLSSARSGGNGWN